MDSLGFQFKRKCRNRRALFYKWGLYGIGFLCLTAFLTGIFTIASVYDRRKLNDAYRTIQAQQKAISEQHELSEKRRQAMAKIQIIVVKTGNRRDAFSEEEKREISASWRDAGYDSVLPDPFKEK